uniref:SUN domain-containing protein n=1 Tax=Periophthalmus magnuspinnatus TaxID=409849 RepID=A0A3B4A0V1_9GOBI
DSDSPAADCEVEPNPFDGDRSDQSSSGPAETDSNVGSKDPEDIPTFDEWKRKVMEVEKEKTVTTHTSTNGAAHPVKKAQKNFNNYASVECGAKILGANPEAKSTSSILKENMDLYMLNPCSNKIWFVIELCEPVQVKQLDIANFELFSSTPKDFLVSISDRYPTNKWLKLGTFHARDERTVQSFPLDEHLYAKYVKVNLYYHLVCSPRFLIYSVSNTPVLEMDLKNLLNSKNATLLSTDYPAGYAPGEGDSKNLIGSAKGKDIYLMGSAQPELEDFSKTATPGTEMPEAAVTDSNNDESAAKEEQIVIPLEKDEDEPSISSTIIYLGEEEVAEENLGDQQKDPCAVLTLAPACSCAASLHEYLLQTCLLHIPQNCTNCQTAEQLQTDVPNWVIYQPPSSYPQPQQTQKDSLETPDKEDSVSEHENKASFTEKTLSSNIVSQLELQTIEPSQTSDHRSTIEPSVTIAIPAEETPQLVFEVPIKLPNSEINQDSAEEKQIESTGTLSSTVDKKKLEATVVPDENKLPEIETIPNPLPSDALSMDSKMEDLNEDIATGISRPSAAASPSVSDIYAEPPNGTELNGSPVHGSSQKESVFMRLNNRIKALEMNMSLSGRYLEQLSQRYRKQMEEMQKAFNKTIIKLQNTSRVAEEQDLRQTESIQQLQGQLANVTRLVLNLSVQVSQLQSEVSDRESYLLLSLFMCLCLGLLLYVNRCRMSSTSCSEPEPPISEKNAALMMAFCKPLLFQRRRRKVKSLEKVETLKPSLHAAEPVQIKGLDKTCNGGTLLVEPNPLAETILQPPFRDAVSEGSSEGSSHSDDPSFCGITSACNRICDGLPAKSRAERRALRRRRPTHSGVVDYLKAPSRHKRNSLPIYTIHDIMDRQEQSSCGLNVHLSGPV